MIPSHALLNIALATVAGVMFFCVILLLKEKKEKKPRYLGSLLVASLFDWAPIFLSKMEVGEGISPLVAVHAAVTILSYVILVVTVYLTMTRSKPYDRSFLPIWSVAYLLGWAVMLTRY